MGDVPGGLEAYSQGKELGAALYDDRKPLLLPDCYVLRIFEPGDCVRPFLDPNIQHSIRPPCMQMNTHHNKYFVFLNAYKWARSKPGENTNDVQCCCEFKKQTYTDWKDYIQQITKSGSLCVTEIMGQVHPTLTDTWLTSVGLNYSLLSSAPSISSLPSETEMQPSRPRSYRMIGRGHVISPDGALEQKLSALGQQRFKVQPPLPGFLTGTFLKVEHTVLTIPQTIVALTSQALKHSCGAGSEDVASTKQKFEEPEGNGVKIKLGDHVPALPPAPIMPWHEERKLSEVVRRRSNCLLQLLWRLRQENHLNLGDRGCSEQRPCHFTPTWATEQDSISKKKKESVLIHLFLVWRNQEPSHFLAFPLCSWQRLLSQARGVALLKL
ncbi:hypothetical protein AAY473_013391 [Plecturocebus cupreus]